MNNFRMFIPIHKIKEKYPYFEEYGYFGKKLVQMVVHRNLRNSTELAELLFEYRKSISRGDYQIREDEKKSKISNIRRTIDEQLKKDSIGISFVSEYCAVLNCSADYFVGIIDKPTHSDTDIHEKIGLTVNAIAALELIKSDVDNIDLFHNNELDTLNFILESIRKKQKNGIGFTESIFHYIGLYLDSERIKKESATHVLYKNNDVYYTNLKIGDHVEDRTVQGIEVKYDNTKLDVNTPDKISVFNPTNNQHYHLKVSELFESNAFNKIQEKLIELSLERKTQYEHNQKL